MDNRKNANVFWYLSNNFGDAVTHYLVKNFCMRNPVWVESSNEESKFMLTGSILNIESPNTIVWGSGIAWSDDIIPNHDIRAVRGNLTLKRVKEYSEFVWGVADNNITVGDPTLALPKIYYPKIDKKYKVGIIPHYIDAFYFYQNLNCTQNELDENRILVIDINSQVEDFVKQVLSCEVIISSTLHGIICADAYGIPSVHAIFTDKIGGDGFKYVDWFSNFDNREHKIYDFEYKPIKISDIQKIYKEVSATYTLNIDVDSFLDSCPL
jgi:pyruvyltransferase